MSKVDNFKRITAEDFEEEDQEMIRKLSSLLTPFLEQVAAALSKGVDFDNLNQVFTSVDVTCTAGVPSAKLQVKYSLKTQLKGIIVTSARNLTDNTVVTSAPFITYSVSGDLITITNITGLPDAKKFRLSIILVG